MADPHIKNPGKVILNDNTFLGGGAVIYVKDQDIEIAENNIVASCTLVEQSLSEPNQIYGSYPTKKLKRHRANTLDKYFSN